MKPWDYDTELTAERLGKIAQLLAWGRHDAVDRHDPDVGGNAWTRGVCAYQYGCFRIAAVAGSAGYEWLGVIDPGKRFQFSVGGRPLRFWRGDPNEPNDRVSCPTQREQLLLDLGDDASAGLVMRIGVTTDGDGDFLEAAFVALRGDVPETVWPIPYDRSTAPFVMIEPERPLGRELPPPAIGLIEDEADERQRDSEMS